MKTTFTYKELLEPILYLFDEDSLILKLTVNLNKPQIDFHHIAALLDLKIEYKLLVDKHPNKRYRYYNTVENIIILNTTHNEQRLRQQLAQAILYHLLKQQYKNPCDETLYFCEKESASLMQKFCCPKILIDALAIHYFNFCNKDKDFYNETVVDHLVSKLNYEKRFIQSCLKELATES